MSLGYGLTCGEYLFITTSPSTPPNNLGSYWIRYIKDITELIDSDYNLSTALAI